MNLVYDFEQAKAFVNILPDLQKDWVYIMSVSARQKHLKPEERKYFSLGRTEMFGRVILRSRDELQYALNKIESMLQTRTTRTGKLFPAKCLIIYININPVSTVEAYFNFSAKLNDEVSHGVLSGNFNYETFKRLDHLLLTAVQKAEAEKVYTDLDFDFPNKQVGYVAYIKPLTAVLTEKGISNLTVETKGGFHVMIKTEELNSNAKLLPVPLHLYMKTVKEELGSTGEAKFNGNRMIPLPGTMQAGFKVKWIT